MSKIPKDWSVIQKFLFRYVFSYLFLYIFPFPLREIPYVTVVTYPWDWFVNGFVAMVSAYVFHSAPDWSHFATGSGDQRLRYIELAAYAMISLPIAVVWTLIDKKRRNYARLFAFLRLWALLFVASNMLSYGAFKIIPSQFPPLADGRLVERVGDMSPMGMLWTFMSSSRNYTMFSGLAEFTAGVLLAIPPTSIFGALVSCAVALQIVALNMCYDVPVKILSTHLLCFRLLLFVQRLRICVADSSGKRASVPFR